MDSKLERADFYDLSVGPFFDTMGLVGWMGISQQTIDEGTVTGDILRVYTNDGVCLYPSFQFDDAKMLLPHLREVLALIDPDNTDPWGSALWLNSPAEEFTGRTPANTLRTGDAAAVVASAVRIGIALAR